jgi:hypothetical protein
MSAQTLKYRKTALAFALAALVAVLAVGCSACGTMMMLVGHGATPPAASEFGLGPRTSAKGVYTATLQPSRPIRPRQMQTVRVVVTDASGQMVDNAAIAIDGGMPQHGHGLPTKPKVTKNPGGGLYEIEGVRFNMGGWWEFTLAITGPAGTDLVTFNLRV